MVDPRINIERRKPFVDMIGPCLAPPFQKLGAVSLAHLLAEPLRPYLAHRQHDVRVRLGLAVLAHVPMHIEVRDHAAFRSEERRGGKECVSTCRSRWSPYH